MKVIYTDQSIDSLEESLGFAVEEQKLTPEKVSLLRSRLFDRADSLALNPTKVSVKNTFNILKKATEELLKVIYKVENGAIYITEFFDSRKDPAKMKT